MIRLSQFGWRFANAPSPAVRDVSLHIPRGDFVAIAGPSGCGKTTLAMAMCGLLVGRQAGSATGSLRVADHDVAATPLHVASQAIGLVQQNPEAHFATLMVCDEIAFGMENHCVQREEIRRRVEESLDLLSIAHLRDRDLATLSGGEKQRVAVASVVAGRPEALILDEPTASLDPQASSDLFHALAKLRRETGLTVVIIEHKLAQLLPLKPRLVCLEQGRVVRDEPDGSAMVSLPSWLGEDSEFQQPLAARGPSAEPASTPASSGEPLVAAADVNVELDGKAILDDVSFQVHAGEIVAVMGPNGGGKTTLLHAVLGLVQLTTGTLRTCGEAMGSAAVSRLATRVGFVFQNADHQLVGETVLDDAMYSLRNFKLAAPDREAEAARCLTSAGLGGRLSDHPFGLSWGQKRRLNLISAIQHAPRLLLLDEPHAGQDWPNVLLMLEWASKILDPTTHDQRSPATARDEEAVEARSRRPGACILVTHDPRVVARCCTRVLFIVGGRIVVDAPVPDAFGRLRAMGFGVYAPPVMEGAVEKTRHAKEET